MHFTQLSAPRLLARFAGRAGALLIGLSLPTLACAPAASAYTVLPGASASVSCAPPLTGPASDFHCESGFSGMGDRGYITFSTSATVIPRKQSAGADASESGPGGAVTGSGSLTYSVQANLPAGVAPGPVALDIYTNAVASGREAAALLAVDGTDVAYACAGVLCGSPGDTPGGWRLRKSEVGSYTGAPLELMIYAGATADSLGGSAAFIDPYVVVDPSTPNASLYTLVFSAGIDNTPLAGMGGGVPEPASWALLLAGVALVGAALRRAAPTRIATPQAI
jgi:hypothetical protein